MSFLQKKCFLLALMLLPLSAAAEEHKHTVKSWTVTEESTCTAQGSKYGVCTACGKKVFRVMEATGHTFGEWTQCGEDLRTRNCSVCGATEAEYSLTPEKDRPLRVTASGAELQLVLDFPQGYSGDAVLTVPAGAKAELLFAVPGGRIQRQTPEETEDGFAFTLPDGRERKSVLCVLPERTQPVTLTVHIPATAPQSLTVHLPAFRTGTELTLPAYAGQTVKVTATGKDAGKASVKTVAPPLSAVLISSDVIEIEYPEPVRSDTEAKALFTVTVGGSPAEWEFLSYFDFGAYAERGGVVSIRLTRALDIGLPAIYAGKDCVSLPTQGMNGPAAAATVRVSCGEESTEAVFEPFWSHILYLEETGAAVWVAEGAEAAQVPAEERGLTVHLLGAYRSVYEDPEYRSLYEPGNTRDTFARACIQGVDGAPVTVKGV